MLTQTRVTRNMWRRQDSGLYLPNRMNFPISGLVFYAPLWHPQFSGSPFNAWDIANNTVISCAVTGATWGIQGSTFDAIDDKITVSASTGIANVFDGGGAFTCWLKPNSDGENDRGRLYNKGTPIPYLGGEAGGACAFAWYFTFSGTDYKEVSATSFITIGSWQMVTVTYNCDNTTNRALVYLNGASGNWSSTTAPTGTRTSDSAVDMVIGNDAGQSSTFDGTIGELLLHDRILTSSEIAYIYRMTKWRYL